ncbi:M14 family metallopeptidase [Neoroseomonas lacus]|uniref:Peptidase M14 n=1 Tax=Neoroseomonas lacus TaxID=287609 RepID=A0A917NVL9_9PROT|nr:hypothetical protein [Neoroseomonas lacus]GGJ33822.1 peptidase M14 [Neoroseomonas lacus]
MKTLLDIQISRAVDQLLADPPGRCFEAWVFEDEPTRRSIEAALRAAGVSARLRSAYKPLLHFFLEEVQLTGLTAVTIRTPSHRLASERRFELEVYPLAGLLASVELRFEAGDDPLHYGVLLEYETRRNEHRVFAPNVERRDPLGDAVLAPCGWVQLDPSVPGAPLQTEYETAFAAVFEALVAEPWPEVAPFFDTLSVAVETGGIERRLSYGDECISTREALHEDLYFSIREFFQLRALLPPGDRTLRLGQVVPDIRCSDGATRLRVTVGPPATEEPCADGEQVLPQATRPLDPDQIATELDALGGERFDTVSYRGRRVMAAEFSGRNIGLVVTAGQHANETSGLVGALRAAAELKKRGLGFALVPLENPDGYALHRELRVANPRHINHAARFSAAGDDLSSRTDPPFGELKARREAYARTNAVLHVNMHGYPAHEFTRPNTGYVPRDSLEWAIPRGFFLIMHFRPGLRDPATKFLHELSARLAELPGLRAFNQAQIRVFEAHLGVLPAPVLNGIVCTLKENPDLIPPFALTTEFPDETIYDDAFQFAHTVQMTTVLEAARLLEAGTLATCTRPSTYPEA